MNKFTGIISFDNGFHFDTHGDIREDAKLLEYMRPDGTVAQMAGLRKLIGCFVNPSSATLQCEFMSRNQIMATWIGYHVNLYIGETKLRIVIQEVNFASGLIWFESVGAPLSERREAAMVEATAIDDCTTLIVEASPS